MTAADLKPGWYASAFAALPNAVRVHEVSNGLVYFTRRGLPDMSISPIQSFLGIVKPLPPKPAAQP
jgi:hypothetical protein